jgi:hypothetical protein
MKYLGLWSRWHRYDSNGIKHIKKFKIDEVPSPLKDEGFTEWTRGTGPLSPQHRQKLAVALRNVCLGVPKSEEQKLKMREAKLGVPKSDEHRENMRKAWERRRKREYEERKLRRQVNG